MDDYDLFKDISKIVENHVKQFWLTPHYKKIIIPNEEIWDLKRDLVNYIESKGGLKNG